MSNSAIPMNGLLEAEFFDLESKAVGDTFRIFTARPPFVQRGKHPAIFVLDGNSTFTLAVGIQRILAWGTEAPGAYVIGIGYPTEAGYMEAVAKRNRDYAPTDGGADASKVLGSTHAAAGKAFLRFLTEELKPEVEARYEIDGDDTTLVGASLGGLFGTWTLLTAPSTFRRYILSSPAVWWNGEEVWRWEQAYADEHDDLPATVFVSAGGLEVGEEMRRNALDMAEGNPMLRDQIEAVVAWHDENGWPRTAEMTVELAGKLRSRNYSGLNIHCHNMPDETHMSVTPAVISRGLRYVFGHWQP